MNEVDLTPRPIDSTGHAPCWTAELFEEARAIIGILQGVTPDSASDDPAAGLEAARKGLLRKVADDRTLKGQAIRALIGIYVDLMQQGWKIDARATEIHGIPTIGAGSDDRGTKRSNLTVRRDEQLRLPATREFISRLEAGRIFRNSRKSIFSLMRDGREVSDNIRPYIEFVDSEKRCQFTGIPLQDIWRYFRHTWSNPYESIPGRSMLGLVRDAAAPDHPVMGIFAISSAQIGQRGRDRHIGWDPDLFLKEVRANPTVEIAEWLLQAIDRFISAIYLTDFVRDGVVPAALPDQVPETVIVRLSEIAELSRSAHHQLALGNENKAPHVDHEASDEVWEAQACTPLFRAKRAAELSKLLETRNRIRSAFELGPEQGLVRLLSTADGRSAFKKVVGAHRAAGVGTEMAELTVCGAVPPYNELVAGKLVAALAVSPQVVAEYKRRYTSAASVIASSMAGRRVVRPNNLVFVGTTSLYGIRPNQYDRISIPADVFGSGATASLRYRFLEKPTGGVGTFQFGRVTKEAIEKYARAQSNGWRANNVFGEGTSPKLRSLRDGLSLLGFRAEDLLHHGMQKAVYGVSLVDNLKHYLLGFDSEPRYIFPLDEPDACSERIAAWWRERWCLPRLSRPETAERLRIHNLVHPIRHGARVRLPDADVEQYRFPVA